MLEAEHLTSALITWEISLCKSLRAETDFKESFKCWTIWCILNEIFAGRVYVTWKKPGQKHQELIRWSKLSAGHAHGSSELPKHCCQGVLLPQTLLTSFTFRGPNCGDCHLMGLLLPLGICTELQSGQRPCVSISTSSGSVTNPKGLAGDRYLTISSAEMVQSEPKTCCLP